MNSGVQISKIEHYQAFVLAAEHESITTAAAALGVSRPTLSRHLSALEQRLGVALLHRSTRRVWPTPAGERLFEQLRPLFGEIAEAEAELLEARDEVSGRLRVSVPPVLAPSLSHVVTHLLDRHPRLRVELLTDVRKVALREDGVEVAVRVGPVGDPELVVRRLGTAEAVAVAAPAYLERAGTPRDVGELGDHLLVRGHDGRGRAMQWWPLRGPAGRVAVDGAFVSNDQRVILDVALAGGGIALLSEFNARAALAEGLLVRVLPEQLGASMPLHLVLTRRGMQPARVRAFVDALVEWFAARTRLAGPRIP